MAAYIIAEVDIHDGPGYAAYSAKAGPTIFSRGGKVLVAGQAETLEGPENSNRIVVLEFPDLATAKGWWSSDDYAGPRAMRMKATTTRMVVADGFVMPS